MRFLAENQATIELVEAYSIRGQYFCASHRPQDQAATLSSAQRILDDRSATLSLSLRNANSRLQPI